MTHHRHRMTHAHPFPDAPHLEARPGGLRAELLSALCLDQLIPLFCAETFLDHLDRR